MTLPDRVQHEIRHALAGIQLERKKMFRAVKVAFEAVLEQEKWMKQIEGALRNGNPDGTDKEA